MHVVIGIYEHSSAPGQTASVSFPFLAEDDKDAIELFQLLKVLLLHCSSKGSFANATLLQKMKQVDEEKLHAIGPYI